MTTPILKRTIPLLLALLLAGGAAAQTARFTPLLGGGDLRDLQDVGGVLYGATAAGGLLVYDPADPADPVRWTTADGLTSNLLTDLAWTGAYLWAASDGGGLTRIELTDAGPVCRQFARAEALSVTAVAGSVNGATERVYYGLTDGGLGLINNGFAGDIYTSNGFPGLVDDRIRALALDGDDLWIGTADGISILRQGLLEDRSAGLGNREVRALAVHPALGVTAATGDGVQVWNSGAGEWTTLGPALGPVADLAVLDGELWALGDPGATTENLHRWIGDDWVQEDTPLAATDVIHGAFGSLWAGGSRPGPDGSAKTSRVTLGRRTGGNAWTLSTPDAPAFSTFDGVEFGADGTLWLGARNGAGWAGWDGDAWTQYLELASAANDSVGLINHDSGLLSMDSAPDGTLWITQFQGGGLLRFDPAGPGVEQITTENSALSNSRIIRVVVHPDGPVLCLSDRFGVDVLIDPDAWRDPASWLVLPTDASGLGGLYFRDAAVLRRDRIAFTSDDGGLVIWDVNGLNGPDAALTWSDASDDWYGGPVTVLDTEGGSFDFRSCKGLDPTAAGTFWAAGSSGLVHASVASFGPGQLTLTSLSDYREMVDASIPGLLRGALTDVVQDRNGDVWVSHDAGLNRVRERADQVIIDGYTSAGAYAAYALDGFFSASVIAGVPEGVIRELDAAADGRRILAGGDNGAVVVDVGSGSGLDQGPLDSVYLYPNPYRPGVHTEGVRAGGFDAQVVTETLGVRGGASVRVYNAEGQLVYRDANVGTDEVFWRGANLLNGQAASGTYLVRLELGGQVVVRPLAVVR